ncbi:hypothetical protein ASZ78_012406, partial [Callipepla squamata]
MPAACALLLLLGLGLAPPAGSLPLAPPRRLPPPPPPPQPPRSRLGRPCSPPAAGHGRSVIDSDHQMRTSLDVTMRTSSSLMGDTEPTTVPGTRQGAEHTVPPASTRTFSLQRAGADGSSYQPSNVSSLEKRIWGFHATSDSMFTTATRGTGRTLQSLPSSTTLVHPAEISTSGDKTIDPPDWTQSPGLPLGAGAGGDTGSTVSSADLLLADPGSTSKRSHGSQEPKSIPTAGEVMLRSDASPVLNNMTIGTLGSSLSSATSLDPTSILGVTLSSSEAETHGAGSWQGGTGLTVHPREPVLTSSLSASGHTFAAVGSSHHLLSSSSMEEGISSPRTNPAYGSATLAGGREGTQMTISVLAQGTESSASYTETTNASEPIHLVSVEQSGMSNTSVGSKGLVTGMLFTHSSKIPTDSSFQNDLTSFPSSHQPVSSNDAEKRTSISHTDGTYISTLYTRGGERTLLSISNSSTSADSSESSTFFSEFSNPSDSSKSAVARDRKSNVSSDGGFVEPSTEPLLVHSSKPLTSASVGNIQNATAFDTELLPTGSSSLSSSVSPRFSSVSSLHHLLSSTPPPTYLYTTSESSEPLSSSVMASSTPLQALSSSLPTSSLASPSYSSVSLLPVFSSPSSVSQSKYSGPPSTPTATAASRRMPSTAAVAGSSSRETSKHSDTHPPQNNTFFNLTKSPPLPTEPMEHLGGRLVSMSAGTPITETVSPRAATSQGKATPPPLLTTAIDDPQTEPTSVPLSSSTSATSHSITVPVVALTTVKPVVLTTPASRHPTLSDSSTTKTHRAPTPTATKHIYTTGESTKPVGPTTTMPTKVTKEVLPATSPPVMRPTSKTTVSTTILASTKPTTILPSRSTAGMRITSPATDVDGCLSNPCPALATCNNTHGSYVCQCPLGYELEKGKCNLVRVFIGQVPLKLNITHGKYTDLQQVEREILAMLNASLSGLPGYYHSTVKATREANVVHVSVQSTFSLASNVTFYDVIGTVKSYIRACKSPPDPCQFISSLKPLHRVGSLCKQKDPECDKETSECNDFDGVALCQCKSGYFKYNKMDHSCRACEDGYKLENETCVRYAYQLITVVIAAAGGGLLLIMGIALIVTCCRKNKNDISKLIFKSGDFQMSPYAEYPKNPRAQEWGRETIEMQENGSTKNLLQMTDVYYSEERIEAGVSPEVNALTCAGEAMAVVWGFVDSVEYSSGSTPVTLMESTTISESPTPTDSSGSTPVTLMESTTISESPTPTDSSGSTPVTPMESTTISESPTPTGSTHTAPGTSSGTTSVPELEGKVFPGTITLEGQFSSNIAIGRSMEYEEMFRNITKFFKSAFASMADYRQTVIVKVNYIGEATSTRSNNLVNVTLMNLFTEDTNETTEAIDKAVKEAIDNLSYVSQYTNTSQCAVYKCDDMTTECEEDLRPTCVCKPDFEKTVWDVRSCSGCSNCSSKENKFCETQNGLPTCKCMSNFKKGEDNKCVSCPVGYSGDNCENNKELILIIVGTVLGAVILCLVVAVSVVSI